MTVFVGGAALYYIHHHSFCALFKHDIRQNHTSKATVLFLKKGLKDAVGVVTCHQLVPSKFRRLVAVLKIRGNEKKKMKINSNKKNQCHFC